MQNNKRFKILLMVCLLMITYYSISFAQRTGYTKEEFIRRRSTLMDQCSDGIVILFGDCMPQPGTHFRQDNDFYYFTGLEDPGSILMMIPSSKRTFLFLPRQTQREERMEGSNLLKDDRAGEKMGIDQFCPVTYMDEFIARNGQSTKLKFHLRLSPRDVVDNARRETQLFIGRKNRIHYNDQISLDNYRIKKLKERYPFFQFHDITPLIDVMRLIKSQEEIEILRRNGKISAEAVKQAMLATKSDVYEYELEAAAIHTILKMGAKGVAYPAIVGSGPNTCILHYNKNSRKIENGDLILMDFGADLDYLCMDITRTWPANGKFTPDQREVYQIVLEVQKACIETYRPGITAEDVRKHVAECMKKKGVDPRGQRGGIGHYVGMCVHDVGPRGIPLKEGMVFAIEPGLYYSEKNIGIRIEDTILITKDGCEVLTKDVPKEINEIETLMAGL